MNAQTAEGGLAGAIAAPIARHPLLSSRQKIVLKRVDEWLVANPEKDHHAACAALGWDVPTYLLAKRIDDERKKREERLANLPVATDAEALTDHVEDAADLQVEMAGDELTIGQSIAVKAVAEYERAHPGCTRTQALRETKTSVATFYTAQQKLRGGKVSKRPTLNDGQGSSATASGDRPGGVTHGTRERPKADSCPEAVTKESCHADAVAGIFAILKPLPPAVRGRVLGAAAVLVGAIDPWKETA